MLKVENKLNAIKDVDENNKKSVQPPQVCNICRSDTNFNLESENIKLECGHIYCKECLTDWLPFQIKKSYSYKTVENFITCPYCKQKSHKLDLDKDEKFNKHIHKNKYDPNKLNKSTNILICEAITQKGFQCKNKAKYGCYCGIHKNKQN